MKVFLWGAGILVMIFCFAQFGYAEAKWLVRSKDSSKSQFTLLEDGSIQRVNRGDPKTTYDQSENRFHSEKQRAKKQTTQPTLDLTGWPIGSQGGPHDAWHVTYVSPQLWAADQVIVFYNLVEGTVLEVLRQITTSTTEMPDLSGWQISGTRFIRSDGTGQEVYFKPNNTSATDISYIEGQGQKDSMVVDYDASGNFVKARISTYEKLSLDAVKIPPYYTELYGWTQ